MQYVIFIICHVFELLVSFLKEWEYIPEFSAETWFKEKKKKIDTTLIPPFSSEMKQDFSIRLAAKSE